MGTLYVLIPVLSAVLSGTPLLRGSQEQGKMEET